MTQNIITAAVKEVKSILAKSRGIITIYDLWVGGDKVEMSTELLTAIQGIKGVESVRRARGYWQDSYVVRTKPCKAYTALAKYLDKCGVNLDAHKVKIEYVEGKRSLYDVTSVRDLRFEAECCESLLAWLKENKATTATVKVKALTHTYRSEGYHEECEWSGTNEYGLLFTLLTKTGRVRCEHICYL